MSEKQKAKIKDWQIIPAYGKYCLIGEVTEHPKLNIDFHSNEQMTSSLIKIDFVNKTAETLNTIYELVDE